MLEGNTQPLQLSHQLRNLLVLLYQVGMKLHSQQPTVGRGKQVSETPIQTERVVVVSLWLWLSIVGFCNVNMQLVAILDRECPRGVLLAGGIFIIRVVKNWHLDWVVRLVTTEI